MVKDIGSRVVGHWILHNRQATIHTPLPFRLLVPILHITTYRRILPHIFGSVLHNKPLSGKCRRIVIPAVQRALADTHTQHRLDIMFVAVVVMGNICQQMKV